MDSPGHCAQFCTYTTIEQDSRDIVHIVSVDKRETNRNSVIMEKECFIRTMEALLPELAIKEVVTDAHPQISALLNPECGKYKAWGIQHSLDIWHAAKSLSKKLRRMMWVGVLHHVRDEHSWATGCCQHEPLEEGSQEKPWIEQGSAAHKALAGVVLDKRWLGLVKKFLNFRPHLIWSPSKITSSCTHQSGTPTHHLSTRQGHYWLPLTTTSTIGAFLHATGMVKKSTDAHTTRSQRAGESTP
ncbi:uncharacterized protein LOC143105969 [Alosa pseudoharengus]|uniref:uncharacterized protein LOC143105969 n=1 Tax=Alosa pseudoharengus TaxID=34774 RepID=UPI003F88E7C6